MATLCTLEQAMLHAKLGTPSGGSPMPANESDLLLKLDIAEELVLSRISQRRDDGSPSWADTVAAWTAQDVPAIVLGAILWQFCEMQRFRGDDDPSTPDRIYVLHPMAERLVAKLHDPTVA